MENTKLPAYPTSVVDNYESVFCGLNSQGEPLWCSYPGGFTKIEMASLMIAQGIVAKEGTETIDFPLLSRMSVSLAKAVLEEANK